MNLTAHYLGPKGRGRLETFGAGSMRVNLMQFSETGFLLYGKSLLLAGQIDRKGIGVAVKKVNC